MLQRYASYSNFSNDSVANVVYENLPASSI